MREEYLAGLFDGEGWICLSKHHREHVYTVVVGIKMASPAFMRQLYASIGYGSLSPSSGANRPTFQWVVSGTNACFFLKTILPYLHIKSEQAQVAIHYQEAKEKLHDRGFPTESEQKAFKALLLEAREKGYA